MLLAAEALLLAAEAMLLETEAMLLPPKSNAFAFLGEMDAKGYGVFNIWGLALCMFGDGDMETIDNKHLATCG